MLPCGSEAALGGVVSVFSVLGLIVVVARFFVLLFLFFVMVVVTLLLASLFVML